MMKGKSNIYVLSAENPKKNNKNNISSLNFEVKTDKGRDHNVFTPQFVLDYLDYIHWHNRYTALAVGSIPWWIFISIGSGRDGRLLRFSGPGTNL